MSCQERAEDAYLLLLAELAQEALDRDAATRSLIEAQAGFNPPINHRSMAMAALH